MQIINCLAFTLLTILIQFSVMEFVQEKFQIEKKPINVNLTSHRKYFHDILHEYTNKPHALYYRTGINRITDNLNISSTAKNTVVFSNTTFLDKSDASTESPTTVSEDFYSESAFITDIETTTDSFYTSTGIGNVTEFILFENKNSTKDKPNNVPKRNVNKEKCPCNFLYKVCDINCCCDSDCSDADIKLFLNCHEEETHRKHNVCYPNYSSKTPTNNAIDKFLCIAKTNLPAKRNINRYKYDPGFVARTKDMALKWRDTEIIMNEKTFLKQAYVYGDPIWLMTNKSVHYLEVSSPKVNYYCSGRKHIQFLKDESVFCNIKLSHLEMIQILKTIEDSSIISASKHTMNASILNCSTLQCTNWSVLVCDDVSCIAYNKSSHEPFCTDSKCTYIALKMDYIFYVHGSKIVNATLKLYTQNVSMILPYMTQEINVRFFITNESIEQTIKFSGAPGYLKGLPVIASFAGSNHTEEFFDSTPSRRYLRLPLNENGKCVIPNTEKNFLKFGINKRTKCRLSYRPNILSKNGTIICKMIHSSIYEYLGLNSTIYVAPSGNPQGQKDEDWIPLEMNSNKEMIDGEFIDDSRIYCRSIATKILLIFTYADKSNIDAKTEYQILTANAEVSMQNVTINVEDLTAVLTIDTSFVDVTKPPVYEYAGSPDLNFRLPKDFFFPFPNKAFADKCNVLQGILFICSIVLIK